MFLFGKGLNKSKISIEEEILDGQTRKINRSGDELISTANLSMRTSLSKKLISQLRQVDTGEFLQCWERVLG